jgi:hypothetical protein
MIVALLLKRWTEQWSDQRSCHDRGPPDPRRKRVQLTLRPVQRNAVAGASVVELRDIPLGNAVSPVQFDGKRWRGRDKLLVNACLHLLPRALGGGEAPPLRRVLFRWPHGAQLPCVHDDSECRTLVDSHGGREYGPAAGIRRYKLARPSSEQQASRRSVDSPRRPSRGAPVCFGHTSVFDLRNLTGERMLASMLNATHGKIDCRTPTALMLIALLVLPLQLAAQGHPAPYLLYQHPSACLTYGGCAGLWWDDRRQPRRPIAPEPSSQADSDIWGSAGSPWGYVRRLPPPTPEGHIQPRYRDASTIRPEFSERMGPKTP